MRKALNLLLLATLIFCAYSLVSAIRKTSNGAAPFYQSSASIELKEKHKSLTQLILKAPPGTLLEYEDGLIRVLHSKIESTGSIYLKDSESPFEIGPINPRRHARRLIAVHERDSPTYDKTAGQFIRNQYESP